MTLRRRAEHPRHQHWTAIGIELAIVVLGVFIGMQVSNWNEERRDRALERQYLERLREDIASSMSGAQDGIEDPGRFGPYRGPAVAIESGKGRRRRL